jgi:hypothetical protein
MAILYVRVKAIDYPNASPHFLTHIAPYATLAHS